MNKAPLIFAIAVTMALCSCGPKFATRELPMPKKAPEGTVFLVQRYSQTTDTGVIAFNPGTEAHVLGKRAGFVTLLVGTVQFEMPETDVTDDLATRDELTTQQESVLKESDAAIEANRINKLERTKAQQIASVEHLTTSRITQLQDSIKSAQAEISALHQAMATSGTSSTYVAPRYYTDSYGNQVVTRNTAIVRGSSDTSPANTARQARIDQLNSFIAQSKTELAKLQADAVKQP